MITINLLPEVYRKAKVSSIQQFHRSPLAALTAGVLVGLLLVLGAVMRVHQMRLAQLTARLQQLQPQKAALDDLRASVQRLRDQQAVFNRLVHEHSQWAQHLNRLSDVTPEGIWFTDLSLDQPKGLIIQGSAIGEDGEEMSRIERLVQDLKADAAFLAAVRELQIESIKSVQEKEVEVIEFTLIGGRTTSPSGGSIQ